MHANPCRVRDRLLIATATLAALASPAVAAEPPAALPETLVTASRLGEGITGASTTVITADEIARSPGESVADVLARVPGIQVSHMYGGVNGTDVGIDMRGFGATYMSNTLILVNGRRLNDNDMTAVDLSGLQRGMIERIEVTRGNAGAVLYGDGAVGGVINIVTKNAANTPDQARIEGAIGTQGQREVNAAINHRVGETGLTLAGSEVTADGYRNNNGLVQRNISGEVRQRLDGGELYLSLSADDRHMGLPGSVSMAQYSAGNTRGTNTPFDFGDKQTLNLALGGTADLASGLELVIDGGWRHKDQQAFYSPGWYIDTTYDTVSFTPRLNAEGRVAGLANRLTTGLDVYQSFYQSDRKGSPSSFALFNRYHLQSRTIAGYAQDTLAVRPDTDLSFGGRLVRSDLSFDDRAGTQASRDKRDLQYALHVGVDHRLSETLAVFGRVGRSVRLPNLDDWNGTTFDLKAQTSRDVEAGVRGTWDRLSWQGSAYLMDLTNELHYDPTFGAWGANINLPPTRRYGGEGAATVRLADTLRLKGGLAYTRAVFTQGALKGNDVPLVAAWTGTAGLSWDAWDKYVVVDLDARYVGSRRHDSDEANTYETIDPHTLVDLRVGGQVDLVSWSLSVQNLFDVTYYDYGGTWAVYPMPGRTTMARLGLTF